MFLEKEENRITKFIHSLLKIYFQSPFYKAQVLFISEVVL